MSDINGLNLKSRDRLQILFYNKHDTKNDNNTQIDSKELPYIEINDEDPGDVDENELWATAWDAVVTKPVSFAPYDTFTAFLTRR